MSVDQKRIPDGLADAPSRILSTLDEMIGEAECVDDVPATGDERCNIEGCARCELLRVRSLMEPRDAGTDLLAIAGGVGELRALLDGGMLVLGEEELAHHREVLDGIMHAAIRLNEEVRGARAAAPCPDAELLASSFQAERRADVVVGVDLAQPGADRTVAVPRLPLASGTLAVARAEAARLAVEAVLSSLGIADPPDVDAIIARALPPGERMRLTSRRRNQRWAVLHGRLLFLGRRMAHLGDRRAGRDHHEASALEEALARWDELPRVVAELHRAEALLSHLLALPAAEREAEIEEMRSGAPSTLATLIARVAVSERGRLEVRIPEDHGETPRAAALRPGALVRLVSFAARPESSAEGSR